MENEIKVICTKCGGKLIPDQEGKIYRCMYCGVAFGSSVLFNEDAPGKAYRSLIIGEYNEADVWYRCVLMRDPGNAQALRGRILCAGKWKRLSDIDISSVMSVVRFKNLFERIAEAAAESGEDYREYFTAFDRLIDDIRCVQKKDINIKPLEVRVKELREKRLGASTDAEDPKQPEKSAGKGAGSSYKEIVAARNPIGAAAHDFKETLNRLSVMEEKLGLNTNPENKNHGQN